MAYQKRLVRPATVERTNSLRALPLLRALDAVHAHVKHDMSYEPMTNRDSCRYHISVNNRDYELLIGKEKWFDTRAGMGGGGAIDLVMHIFAEPFCNALKRLNKAVP